MKIGKCLMYSFRIYQVSSSTSLLVNRGKHRIIYVAKERGTFGFNCFSREVCMAVSEMMTEKYVRSPLMEFSGPP